jgi:hypothetical protein
MTLQDKIIVCGPHVFGFLFMWFIILKKPDLDIKLKMYSSIYRYPPGHKKKPNSRSKTVLLYGQ